MSGMIPGRSIDLAAINREDFYVDLREHAVLGPVVLIHPQKSKFKWSPDEYHMRSLLCRPNGEVISAGFGKFFNWSEKPELDALLATVDSPHFVTSKMDGSLIIRSVVDGHVIFRTRGSHELGVFEEPVMTLVKNDYPFLLDPTLAPDSNLLLEYVGPNNHHVVRYDYNRLVGLAQTWFTERDGRHFVKVVPFPHSVGKTANGHWHVPNIMKSPPKHLTSMEQVRDSLIGMEKEEGYVVWKLLPDDAGYHLTKFKCSWYLKLHALRSEASPRFIREYCVRHDIISLTDFQHRLADDGFDWEMVSYLEPAYMKYENHADEVHGLALAGYHQMCEHGGKTTEDRKTKALACKQAASDVGDETLFSYLMMQALGKENEARDLLDARVLECGAVSYKALKQSWRDEDAAKAARAATVSIDGETKGGTVDGTEGGTEAA